jgi:hypothetical protein
MAIVSTIVLNFTVTVDSISTLASLASTTSTTVHGSDVEAPPPVPPPVRLPKKGTIRDNSPGVSRAADRGFSTFSAVLPLML